MSTRETTPVPITLQPREVPLGGPRAMTVRRTLPHRDIRTVGAWCFVDDYGPTGPDDPPMAVPPHPHTGLQTVTWLLDGQVTHRDSTGASSTVAPGELNIMTSGWGIAHSEYSAEPASAPLRGLQLWVALPAADQHPAAGFAHHPDLPTGALVDEVGAALRATVIVGTFAGAASPAKIFSPLVGVELTTQSAGRWLLPLRADFEYAILALDEPVTVGAEDVPPGAMRYLGWREESVAVTAAGPTTFLLLGGEPLAEELVMWWNFVGRTHDDIESARADWMSGSERFGVVAEDPAAPLPAPGLPHARLRPRPGRR